MGEQPIRILLVDDDRDDQLIIGDLLRDIFAGSVALEFANSFERGREKIEQKLHDLYLIDYRLGERSGLELLRAFDLPLRAEPFIILTGAGDESVERQAMEVGAADYLVKGDFSAALLQRVIRYALARKHMEAQRVQHLLDMNRSKDEFVALASHQLRTPATAVKQYVGMLLEGYAGDMTTEQISYLERAYASNERQLRTVDDILRVAQLDLQKIHLRIVRNDLAQLLHDCLRDTAPVFMERTQTVDTSFPDKPILASIDPAYLGMAINNLLDNASKYSQPKSTVWVRLDQKHDTCHIVIRDQGVGIASVDHDKLFKKFSRIPNPLSVAVGGNGLGLYWANEVIKLHGGSISVGAPSGGGTTFTVSLPQSGVVLAPPHAA